MLARGVGPSDPRRAVSRLCPTGWPPLTWLVIYGKHLTKPPKDWHPSAQDVGAGTAYIEVGLLLTRLRRTLCSGLVSPRA